MPIVDLSHRLTAETPTHPYDSPTRLFQEKFLEQDGFNAFRLETALHVGTHVDAPAHFLAAERVCDLPLERFWGKGVLLNAAGQARIRPGRPEIPEGSVVLVHTGWDKRFGQADYFQGYPVMEEDFAAWLVTRGVKLLGVDAPSPDGPPFPVHRLLLENGIPLIENLTGLEQLRGRDFTVCAFPLALAADASPARVVAWWD